MQELGLGHRAACIVSGGDTAHSIYATSRPAWLRAWSR
jgi:hypothetical protein